METVISSETLVPTYKSGVTTHNTINILTDVQNSDFIKQSKNVIKKGP
jgi:hypothetical protein